MAKKKQGKITKEFENCTLGDSRLNSRLVKMVDQLNKLPSHCINAAAEDWKSKKAAYRFFDNEKTSVDEILSPHFERTSKRMSAHNIIYSIQDTSFINFNTHKKTKGLGSIGRYANQQNPVQGLILHTSLALSYEGLPLGLQSFEVWSRPEFGYRNNERDENNGDNISENEFKNREKKESAKWLTHLDEALDKYDEKTKMILLADRESDYFELFDKIKKTEVDAVIRSKHDRSIKGRGLSLKTHLGRSERRGEVLIKDIKTKKNGKRAAKAEIKFSKIQIEVPGSSQKRYPFGLELNVVEAKEIDPPENENPLEWRLLTTLSVENFDDAIEIISHYKKRWNIESFFKVLKSGCKIEDCRLETAEKLKKYIAIMSVIGWRIYWAVHINRISPKEGWGFVLTELEYLTLWVAINKKEIIEGKRPKKPPSEHCWKVRDAIREIAKLGGFNGRSLDGEPGMVSIWRGWMRLSDMTLVSEALL